MKTKVMTPSPDATSTATSTEVPDTTTAQAVPAVATTIKDFEPMHQPAFARLYRAWFTGHFHENTEPTDEYVLTQPQQAILDHGGVILVATAATDRGEELAGVVALKKMDSDTVELTKMVVDQAYRGKGLGEELVGSAIRRARSMGISRIILYSHSSLQPAIKLYRRHGFTDIPLENGIYSHFRCDVKMELCLDDRNDPDNRVPITIERVPHSRIGELDWDHLPFGRHCTDHMLVCDFAKGYWQPARIVPFGDFSISPNALCFHYGQTFFEGMKAFRLDDGRINIFRIPKHYERMTRTAERMCMPVIPSGLFTQGLQTLVGLDRAWAPRQAGGSLYIRPLMIATETRLGVKVSDAYRFFILCSPAGAYYNKPLRLKVETEFVRAAKGGTGYAKCGGNYGGAFYPAQKAQEQGYDQVLWTDGRENRFIEESGLMNVFFVIKDCLVTPPLSDSILDGVTRDSFLTLAARLGIPAEARPISVEELHEGLSTGSISEAFGAGTGAVVAPIDVIGLNGKDYTLPALGNDYHDGDYSGGDHPIGGQRIGQKLRTALDDIRYGRAPDPYGWNTVI